MVSLNKIIQAKITIGHFVTKTPFAQSAKLSKILGANVYLKEENLQRTGAYKIRGAYNKIASLSEEERKRGVVAASAGNHAK
ncbi:pyridoxal-phosphate dependent enzyme, partial [Campylobacter concisus]|uniref:pyridoxal-phosphate dependent enzyme n=1 Tax=Campylobacter concisus TaxID=199 RepID=UPI00112F839A